MVFVSIYIYRLKTTNARIFDIRERSRGNVCARRNNVRGPFVQLPHIILCKNSSATTIRKMRRELHRQCSVCQSIMQRASEEDEAEKVCARTQRSILRSITCVNKVKRETEKEAAAAAEEHAACVDKRARAARVQRRKSKKSRARAGQRKLGVECIMRRKYIYRGNATSTKIYTHAMQRRVISINLTNNTRQIMKKRRKKKEDYSNVYIISSCIYGSCI